MLGVLGVGGLGRNLRGRELALGGHGVSRLAGGAETGLKVALGALSRAVADVRDYGALALRRIPHNGWPRVVVGGRRIDRGRLCAERQAGRQGRAALLQRHLGVVRIRVIERGRPSNRRSEWRGRR